MKRYIARQSDNLNSLDIYLSNSNQFDEYLGCGASIYEIDKNKETLIATPKDGFLIERPVFPIPHTSTRGRE